MNKLVLFIILLLTITVGACKHEIPDPTDGGIPGGPGGPFDPDPQTGEECDPDIVYFEQDILPFFTARCGFSGCHDSGTNEDGVTLDNYNDIVADLDIFDDDWNDNELYEVIVENDPRMPPDPYEPLTDDQIDMLFLWIQQGAPNNSCEGCVTENITYQSTIGSLIANRCQGCHSGNHAETNLTLLTYEQIKNQALNGPLLNAIKHTGNATPMPYNSPQLPQCEIDQIEAWINAGAPF